MELLIRGRFLVLFVVFAHWVAISCAVPPAQLQDYQSLVLGGKSLEPLATGLFQFSSANGPTQTMAAEQKNELILSAKRTSRPDIFNRFKPYHGGWDISNRHYWASVGFTGAAGFILAILWFVSFGVVLAVHRCCRWGMNIKKAKSHQSQRICLALLLLFTCAAAVGCILLSVGQNQFHGEVSHTIKFVVNQSDFTVQILKNVTGYLSLAKSINVDQIILSSEDQSKIDSLNVDLNKAANILSDKTSENSAKIKKALNAVRFALIAVAAVMLLLAIIGFVLTLLGHRHAIYIFILSGWLLVAVTFILFGVFVILENAVSDTCLAMDEWVDHPQAETALSNILPCVDERTTNQTLYQSKEVISQIVNVVNTAIYTIANSDPPPAIPLYYYNQSGPLMPPLCNPFDSQLNDRQCQEPWEVSFANASTVWQNYTCKVSASGSCITSGRVTPEIYSQLVAAVNVSYALLHYAPLVLSLQDCNFVRETFTTITSSYCSPLEHYLKMVSVGLALISVGIMLCLVLWILYANRPLNREEVFAKQVYVVKDTRRNMTTIGNIEEC